MDDGGVELTRKILTSRIEVFLNRREALTVLLPKSEKNIPIKESQKNSNERTKHENHKKR